MTRRRITVIGLALAAWLVAAAPSPATPRDADPAAGELLQLSSDLRLSVRHGRDVELAVRAWDDDDFGSIAERMTGSLSNAGNIERLNSPTEVAPGRWIRVPIALLTPEFRSLALRDLFPQDYGEGADWIHVARAGRLPTYDEGLWQVAEWFVGRGEAFADLMRANNLSSPELRAGQTVRIPGKLTHAAFHARMRSDDGGLEFGSDTDGPFAAYRLKPGEALYSAVVLRFTGRTSAEDVSETAQTLIARSNIRDARDIPVGYEIKIPLELLEPEHLPKTHPRRREAEEQQAALERSLAQRPVTGTRGGLEGVIVVIDPGHGGRDLGTNHNGIWEHDYVYDVSCRLKYMLERETAARVVMTLEDKKTGCLPSRGDKLAANQQGTILTTPTFLAKEKGEAKIGVNLRWYLANSVYRQALADGHRDDRIVFVSLHADARHAGLRGLMVYVPGASYRTRTYGSTSSTYRKYEEVKEKPTIRFSKSKRVRSEAISRELAGSIVESFRKSGLPIQPYQPIRDKVIRGKERWVPAVLRGNAIPTKVLVEMLNLSNPEDARLLGSARTREQLARALHLALFDHFGERRPAQPTTTAAQ
jgi:N-acetylmuramoyl-L-alanine amidase